MEQPQEQLVREVQHQQQSNQQAEVTLPAAQAELAAKEKARREAQAALEEASP